MSELLQNPTTNFEMNADESILFVNRKKHNFQECFNLREDLLKLFYSTIHKILPLHSVRIEDAFAIERRVTVVMRRFVEFLN